MSTAFYHGAEVRQSDNGVRLLQVQDQSSIVFVGTAPEADTDAFPAGEPILINGSRTEAAKLDTTEDGTGGGTLADAVDAVFDQGGVRVVVIREEEGLDDDETETNIIGGVGAGGNYTGLQAIRAVRAKYGFDPGIVAVPGFSQREAVVAELPAILDSIRAVGWVDGPDTDDADAITFRETLGSRRLSVIDPWMQVRAADGSTVARPGSAVAAGVEAVGDRRIGGYAKSVSNQLINGIIGTTRSIDFAHGDPNTRANLLNENDIWTVIQEQGFRLWGGRTCSEDAKWADRQHVRLDDRFASALIYSHMWAIDRNITKTYADDVRDGILAFIRGEVANETISGGNCVFSPELNTAESMDAGRAYWDIEYGRYGRAERLTFTLAVNNDYTVERIFG